jgi:hypothetical protein
MLDGIGTVKRRARTWSPAPTEPEASGAVAAAVAAAASNKEIKRTGSSWRARVHAATSDSACRDDSSRCPAGTIDGARTVDVASEYQWLCSHGGRGDGTRYLARYDPRLRRGCQACQAAAPLSSEMPWSDLAGCPELSDQRGLAILRSATMKPLLVARSHGTP